MDFVVLLWIVFDGRGLMILILGALFLMLLLLLLSRSRSLGLLFYCLLLRYFVVLVRHLRCGVGVRRGIVIISLSSWFVWGCCHVSTCDV